MKEIIKLSSFSIPGEWNLKRDHTRDEKLINDAYIENFDYDTLFYDVCQTEEGVKIIAPPFCNLLEIFENSRIKIDNKKIKKEQMKFINFDRTSVISFKNIHNAKTFSLKQKNKTFSCNVSQDYTEILTNKNVLFTMSKNNNLLWIKSWAKYYAKAHKVNAVIIFDNGSDTYSEEDLLELFIHDDEFENIDVLIIPMDFKFGPQGWKWQSDKVAPWDSDFLQLSAFEIIKNKFIKKANLAINADIDELLFTETGQPILNFMESRNSVAISHDATWVENITRNHEVNNFDIYTTAAKKIEKMTYKWCIRPKYIDFTNVQLAPHHTLSLPANYFKDEVGHYHFSGISTSWKFSRVSVNHFDKKKHKLNRNLVRTISKAIELKNVLVDDLDNTIAESKSLVEEHFERDNFDVILKKQYNETKEFHVNVNNKNFIIAFSWNKFNCFLHTYIRSDRSELNTLQEIAFSCNKELDWRRSEVLFSKILIDENFNDKINQMLDKLEETINEK